MKKIIILRNDNMFAYVPIDGIKEDMSKSKVKLIARLQKVYPGWEIDDQTCEPLAKTDDNFREALKKKAAKK